MAPKKTIKELEQKLEEMTELGKRTMADMENMKRRFEEERTRASFYANLDMIKAIIPVIDNFKRAQTHLPENLPDNVREWLNGILQIFGQMSESLTQLGVKEIDALGQPFNPTLHEAVLQDKGPKDEVLEVLENGYILGDHVIRPAKVKVGMGE